MRIVPPKTEDPKEIRRFYDMLCNRINDIVSSVTWGNIDFSGSSLSDIERRQHSQLTAIGEINASDTNTARDKHLSNNDAKVWTDHVNASMGVHGLDSDDAVAGTDELRMMRFWEI